MTTGSAPTTLRPSCHACGGGPLIDLPEFAALARVTSDSKPWPAGGRLAVCSLCGLVQTPADEIWRDEIARIYQDYSIYYQSAGAEQPVFDAATGQACPRSTQIIRRLRETQSWPDQGRMLDIGCGNGSFLRRIREQFPNWVLAGTELNDKYRAQVESLPGVEQVYVRPLREVPGSFHFVSLIHVFEHIEKPGAFLADAARLLETDGHLFIEVPDYRDNPFELLIADHASHFTLDSLRHLVESLGFEILVLTNQWVPKELSLLARKSQQPGPLPANIDGARELAAAEHAVHWLARVARQAAEVAAKSKNFGLFGSAIVGTWLGGDLAEKVAFFVDEDPHRAGKFHLGKPILSPADVPEDSDVFVGLAPIISRRLAQRLARPQVRYHPVIDLS